MKLQKLVTRRAELIQRIEQQRDDIKTIAHSFERPISYFDKGYALIQKIKQQPKLVTIGALLFAVALRKPVFKISMALLPIARLFLLSKK